MVHLGHTAFRRIVTTIQPDQVTSFSAGGTFGRAPRDVGVLGIHHDVIERQADFGIQLRIRIGSTGLVPRFGDLAVAVGVDDLRAPAIGQLLVMGLVPHAGVDPAEDRTQQFVEVQGVILVVAEIEMVGGVAGVDQFELAGLGIVYRGLTVTGTQWIVLRVFVLGAFHTPGGLVVADLRSQPYTTIRTHHRVVRISRVFQAPQPFHAPEVGRIARCRETGLHHAWIFAGGDDHLVGVIGDRIHHVQRAMAG